MIFKFTKEYIKEFFSFNLGEIIFGYSILIKRKAIKKTRKRRASQNPFYWFGYGW